MEEPIIIDGVDVSECKYVCNTAFGKIGCKQPLMEKIYCSENLNCYFKQLQKEKFENLNNRQIVESAENLIYENSELYKNLKEKEQECEELKKQLETSEEWRIKAESLNEKLELRNTCYREALDEIERELKEDIYCESQECGCDDYEECLRCTKNIILDIISRAKGGRK